MDRCQILKCFEKRLSDYSKFEEMIIQHLQDNYFALVYQSLYNQLGYEKRVDNKFTTSEFKNLLLNNNFVSLINDIYRTRMSWNGIEEINKRLQNVKKFDDYESALRVFKGCNPTSYNNGSIVPKSAFSLGTKILHYYDPQKNPIVDSVVRANLNIKDEMTLELCLEFRKAANDFVTNYSEHFINFYKSGRIGQELEKRQMLSNFPIMEIFDMALYEPEK